MAAITDLEKLRVLLPHWIEHNAKHAAEFRQWAERGLAGHHLEEDNGQVAAVGVSLAPDHSMMRGSE